MIKMISAFAAAGLALAPVSATMAATQDGDIIQKLFDKAAEVYQDKGFSPTGFQQRGEMKQGGEASFSVTLKGGSQYSVVGVCDTDCSNLDSYITDSSGNLVDSDVEDDDFPIVSVNASGTYTVRLVMKACSSAPCAFGVKAFKQ